MVLDGRLRLVLPGLCPAFFLAQYRIDDPTIRWKHLIILFRELNYKDTLNGTSLKRKEGVI